MRVRSVLWVILWIGVGIAIGIASALIALELGIGVEWVEIEIGEWRISLLAGSIYANPYTRAYFAKNFLYLLNSSETIYFEAHSDSDGRRLDRSCDYKVVGKDLPTRWWSVTVYGEDNFLIPNEYNKYSVSSASAVRSNSSWVIYISKEPKGENWIPLRGDGGFIVVLRLYNPDPIVYEKLRSGSLELPKIIREGCK
jgi:hypothetical protein